MAPLDLPPYDARRVAHNREIKMVTTLLTRLILPPLISIIEVTDSLMKREGE